MAKSGVSENDQGVPERDGPTLQIQLGSSPELRAILTACQDGILVADVESKRFLLANPAICRMTGYSKAELLSMGVTDFHPAADLPRVIEAFERQVRRDLAVAADLPVLTKDGVIFCDVTSAPLQIGEQRLLVGFFHDTTQRKTSEEALRASQQQLNIAFDAAPIGVAMVGMDRRFIKCNQSLCRTLGYSEEELKQKTIADITFPDDMPASAEALRSIVAGEKNVVTVQKRHVRKDGSHSWSEVHINLVRSHTGEPLYFLPIILDITERKLAEEENLRLEAQILQTQKLESLGLLAGGIAHDFNNMLMVILGSADLADDDLPANSPAKARIQDISNVAKRAADLCNHMLDYAGKGHFIIKPTSLSDVVSEIQPMLAISVSKNVALHLHLADSLPAIEADPAQLRQVVMNLVINASEAVGDRAGDVTVTTGLLHCDRHFVRDPRLHGILSEGDHVYLEVTDTGCGMDDNTIKNIFDPFFTTKFTGRGLGLASVHGIMRAHKGAIRIRSAVGHGTTLMVLFPASTLYLDHAAAPRADAHSRPFEGDGSILLVDDEEPVIQVTRLLLENLGCAVLTANSGSEAMAIYKQHRAHIKCVLLDLMMPGMDGEQTLEELRKIDPDVRVILCSGYSEQSIPTRFLTKGLAAFIQKPYGRSDLRKVLQSVLQS